MLSFLRLLRQRYQAVSLQLPPGESSRRQEYERLVNSLGFAAAWLEKLDWLGNHPWQPRHVAILGPTQAGKSSVINWLLDSTLAEESPLAGFTVHPQGFAVTPDPDAFAAIDSYFHAYRRCERSSLEPERLDAYSLECVPSGGGTAPLAGCIFWDTPDFDSVKSAAYLDAVLRVAALADVVLLVVSKDKYADLSVWEFMKLLEPLRQPTVAVLNKTDEPSRSTLLRSLEETWRSHRGDTRPPVIVVPYLADSAERHGQETVHRQLLDAVASALAKVDRKLYPGHAHRLLTAHWPAWTAPLLAERQLRGDWSARIDAAMDDCVERYRRDYQDQPHHYETFQMALAELLTLLEIPGIGSALLTARRVVTWPLRQIVRLGRMAGRQGGQPVGGEAAVLRQLAEHALARLGESLLLASSEDPLEQRWWSDINRQIAGQRPRLLASFETATQAYIGDFQPEIDRTARGLYAHLQEHPMVLNSLRATRVTTDAAALAVALHTGGIGVQDFVIAPAMLSVTTLLAESALGRYMDKAAEQLKLRQKNAVAELFKSALREPLLALPDRLDPDTRLGIPDATLEAATARLRQDF